MLIKRNDVLVPHDMDQSLLDFVLADEGKNRFMICMHIADSPRNQFYCDVCHIVAHYGNLRVHSQATSRVYDLYLHAWEHVYCLMPSAKRNRTKNSGWVSKDARTVMDNSSFNTGWKAKEVAKFITQHLEDRNL